MTDSLYETVIAAAILVDQPGRWAAMRGGVAAFAGGAEASALERLARSLEDKPPAPPGFRPHQPEPSRSVAWSLLWEETVREVFLQCGGRGVHALRVAAFPGHGGVEGAALSLLCRLAALGVGRAPFLRKVRRQFPHMALEARALLVDTLRRQGLHNDSLTGRDDRLDPAFGAQVERLTLLSGWREALEWLSRPDGQEGDGQFPSRPSERVRPHGH